MVRRRTRILVARLLLGAVFFAQAAVATAACDMPVRAPAQVFIGQESMPCHEEPARNANLCLAHCLSDDQSIGTPQFLVPAWIGVVFLVVPVAESWGGPAAVLPHVLPRAAAPPPRILFQTFLI